MTFLKNWYTGVFKSKNNVEICKYYYASAHSNNFKIGALLSSF